MPAVLFVCTANRFRSPIAEASFKAELAERQGDQTWEVSSAGIWTEEGLSAMPDAIRKATELGLDIQAHRSRVVTADLLQKAGLILVMEQGQKEALQNEFPQDQARIYLLSEATRGIPYDIPDPVIEPADGDVAAEINQLIKKYFDRIVNLASA